MGQALYRTYRSKSLDEIVGQEHITMTLKKALESGHISHAYLFTGPRGTGKTSIARILAHAINKLSYEEGQTHPDIIEIDAASNNGVEDVRDLREKAYIAPAQAKYKVYIIDEVHMLSKAAFNALLKILEEPPVHVIFILATTEVHKLPETIISRTQRYIFKPIEENKVVAHLRTIADKEKIAVTDEALALIAEYGEGSLRDSTSLLDRVRNHDREVDASELSILLGIPPLQAIETVVHAAISHNVAALLKTLTDLYDQGFQAAAIAKQVAELLRYALINTEPLLPAHHTLELLKKLLDVPSSSQPDRYLEIILLDQASIQTSLQTVNTTIITTPAPIKTSSKVVTSSQATVHLTAAPTARPTAEVPKEKVEVKPTKELSAPPTAESEQKLEVTMSGDVDAACWPDVLAALKQKYNTLYGVIKMGQPNFSEPGKLELTFAFAFHQKRINDAKNKKILADIITQVTGKFLEIKCIHDKDIQLRSSVSLPEIPDDSREVIHNVTTQGSTAITSVSNIFGGAELLES